MLYNDCYRNGSVGKKKISGRVSERAWGQDEMIDGKPSVVK
jgi:hypothetical protein